MPRTKAPHHKGGYQVAARQVRDTAYLNTDTRCMSCGRTLAEIHHTKPDAKWTAGHVVDGQVGGELAPECSPCNYGRGASLGNRQRGRGLMTSRNW